MDPNQDGFVSKTNAGFSNDGYNVDEFEITMDVVPASAADLLTRRTPGSLLVMVNEEVVPTDDGTRYSRTSLRVRVRVPQLWASAGSGPETL